MQPVAYAARILQLERLRLAASFIAAIFFALAIATAFIVFEPVFLTGVVFQLRFFAPAFVRRITGGTIFVDGCVIDRVNSGHGPTITDRVESLAGSRI